MKRKSIIYCTFILLAALATSCVKVIDKFNSNNLTVTFNNAGALFLTGDKTVSPKDSINFSYAVSCTTPMTYLTLTKNDNEVARDSIKTGDRMSFSAIKRFVADTIPGQYVYKVVARDNNSVYLGSSAPIIVTVTSDFTYYTNQRLYVPDTTTAVNKCYYSIGTQTSYSYTDVKTANNSSAIDIGYFFDPTISSGTTPKGHTIYNLALSPQPSAIAIAIYDISTFTKNATQLKVITTPTWANLNSGRQFKSLGVAAFATPSANSVNLLAAGSVVLFKTVAGKYGVLQVTYVNQGSSYKSTYMNFEVKLQN